MLKQLLAESLIVLSGTVFFVALAATVGIPGDDRDPAQAVAPTEQSGHATPLAVSTCMVKSLPSVAENSGTACRGVACYARMHVEPLPDTQSRDREGAVAAQVRLIRQRPRSPFWLRLVRVRDEPFPIRPAGFDPYVEEWKQ